VLAAQTTAGAHESVPAGGSFADAQALFYNGHYEPAAALASNLIEADPDNLQLYDLRTSALLFQIKRLMADAPDKEKALKQCEPCADLIAAFQQETVEGLAHARAQLKSNPRDDNAQFMLGKLDLNHVWLYLGTLGRRTGWNEYWEARHSLDAVLERNPNHLRARLARAWIDYIVDTRMSWGTRWILGGGNKKKALTIMREAASADEDFYTSAEARFALWDVQKREKNFGEAVVTARRLSEDFPRNVELTKFIELHNGAIKPK
jgi:tetratricopeptide (TPR) repeat protein